MSHYTIDEARRKVISCAKSYQEKLENNQFLILYCANNGVVSYIEPVFLDRNYQHLTGLLLLDRNGRLLDHQACNFYRKCIDKKLGNSEIAFKKDGTTQLKLDALPAITKITSITKMVGTSNNNQPYLYVDKVAGGTNFCLGLRIDEKINEYVPVSALHKDIRELTDNPSRVIAIFERIYNKEETYSTIRYVAKGINLLKCNFSDEVNRKISLANYVPKNI